MNHSIKRVTLAELRAERVLEVGRATGTSVLFVLTERGLHLLHVEAVPDRRLDGYAIQLATTWLEYGHSAYEVASNLGITAAHLASELDAAGYERRALNDTGPREGATARRKEKLKRSKGRTLVRVGNGRYKFAHSDGSVSAPGSHGEHLT